MKNKRHFNYDGGAKVCFCGIGKNHYPVIKFKPPKRSIKNKCNCLCHFKTPPTKEEYAVSSYYGCKHCKSQPPKRSSRTSTGWEKEFNRKFPNAIYSDLTVKRITTRFNAVNEVKDFIKSEKEKSYEEGLDFGKSLALKLAEEDKYRVGFGDGVKETKDKSVRETIKTCEDFIVKNAGTYELFGDWYKLKKKLLSSLNPEGDEETTKTYTPNPPIGSTTNFKVKLNPEGDVNK